MSDSQGAQGSAPDSHSARPIDALSRARGPIDTKVIDVRAMPRVLRRIVFEAIARSPPVWPCPNSSATPSTRCNAC